MAEQKPAAGNDLSAGTERSDKAENEEPPNAAKGTTDNDENKHVVRIVGTYSLFTFLEEKGQRAFFQTITSEEFEKSLEYTAQYARSIEPFHLDTGEKEFELRMTNMGFIREGFWKEAFPPIFQLDLDRTDLYGPAPSWLPMLPSDRQQDLLRLWPSSYADFQGDLAEAYFYAYSLQKAGAELEKVKQELGPDAGLKFHIGLNKFGIVNVGLTIKWKDPESNFENLCKRAYNAASHLQEDPLEDLKREANELPAGDQRTFLQGVSNALDTRNCPRLVVSYFQVLAITTIHRFLHDKLAQGAILGFQNECLANPWELSNKIPESTSNGLPPLRHVVFMYQLAHPIFGKEGSPKKDSPKKEFLEKERRALLTLGHNVGWSPSDAPPFPAFDHNAPLDDSSLLETSCCLVFPQGLVVVIPPDRKGVQTLYPGGMYENTSSSRVTYRDYWKLIFKLFIRVTEARLLIGMVNTCLTDLHKDFLRCPRTVFRLKTFKDLSKIHDQLIHVGLIIQRTSGRVITPEVTRYSFVRKKLIDFLKAVNFEDHRGYIQSEFQKLSEWVEAVRTVWVARVAIFVASLSFLAAVAIGGIQIYLSVSPDCPSLQVAESAKDPRGEMDKLKTTTADLDFKMKQLQAKIEPLAKDLEVLKRCQHHKQKAHKQ